MSDDRLPAHLEAGALRRQAEAEGGHATILKRGDPDRGAILLILATRGAHVACAERALAMDGRYQWQTVGPDVEANPAELEEFVAKRRKFDEDLWVVELDIADPQRFIAYLRAEG